MHREISFVSVVLALLYLRKVEFVLEFVFKYQLRDCELRCKLCAS